MTNEEKMRELSRQLAIACGLHPRTPAGEIHDSSGTLVLNWYRCNVHNTWLQPCLCGGFAHWHCRANNGACKFIRNAKMRTKTEREIFRLMKFIEQNG